MERSLIWITVLFFCGQCDATPTGFFWHITDLHYDPTYWTSQLSCNSNVSNPGEFGDYWCDSPWLLVTEAIKAMANLKSAVDFIIWTGDSVPHIPDANLTVAFNLEILKNITEVLNTSFSQVPVYASLGNHDFYPNNQANFDKNNEIYLEVAELWESWIKNQSGIEQFKEGGYYMARISSKIRLLALNTNLYYTSNRLTTNVDDPAGQMAWMTQQLNESRSLGEKVIITGHIPPAIATPLLVRWFYAKHQSLFVNILLEYSDVIIATHYGHEHSDGFKIVQDKAGSKAVAQFTASSVTPWRYRTANFTGDPHNPGIRLVQYDIETGQNINYEQYYINLTNSNQQQKTNWAPLYNFKDAYKASDMSVTSIRNIYSQMEYNKGKEFSNKYCTYSLVSSFNLTCTDDMRAEVYCAGLNYDLTEAQDCKTLYLKNLNAAQLNCMNLYLIAVAVLVKVFVTLS